MVFYNSTDAVEFGEEKFDPLCKTVIRNINFVAGFFVGPLQKMLDGNAHCHHKCSVIKR